MGQEDGLVKFAYAELIQGQWQTQKFQIEAKNFLAQPDVAQPDVAQALENSKVRGDWVQINSK